MSQAHMIRFDLQDVGHGDALTVKTTKTTAVCGLVKSSLSMTAESEETAKLWVDSILHWNVMTQVTSCIPSCMILRFLRFFSIYPPPILF